MNKRNWAIIKDLISSKACGTDLEKTNQFKIDDYIFQINELTREGVLNGTANTSKPIDSVEILNKVYRVSFKLSPKGWALKDLCGADVFDLVIKSLEDHNLNGPIDLVMDLASAAVKNAVLRDLNIK